MTTYVPRGPRGASVAPSGPQREGVADEPGDEGGQDRAHPVAAGGQFSWPSVGWFVTARGQFLMAAVKHPSQTNTLARREARVRGRSPSLELPPPSALLIPPITMARSDVPSPAVGVQVAYYAAADGEGIAIARFTTREALDAWVRQPDHVEVQKMAHEIYESLWVQTYETYREGTYVNGKRTDGDLSHLFVER